MIFDIKEIAENFLKNITDIGNVNNIQDRVGNTLSFTYFDLIASKHLGKKIKPTTEAKEKRKPTSCIKNGLNKNNNVTQRIKVAGVLLSLPNRSASKEKVVIVAALTNEDDKPENIEKPQIQSIFNITAPLPLLFRVKISTPDATSATLYPDAAIIWETPLLLNASLKSF